MRDQELYRQKKQAELDAWQAQVDQFKAKVSHASADAQLEMNRRIKTLEIKIEEANVKMAAILDVSEEAWDSFKEDLESAWDSVKSTFSESASMFK